MDTPWSSWSSIIWFWQRYISLHSSVCWVTIYYYVHTTWFVSFSFLEAGPAEPQGHRDNVPVLFENLFSKSHKMSRCFFSVWSKFPVLLKTFRWAWSKVPTFLATSWFRLTSCSGTYLQSPKNAVFCYWVRKCQITNLVALETSWFGCYKQFSRFQVI